MKPVRPEYCLIFDLVRHPQSGPETDMKITQTTLDKLGNILEESGYVVRYERGTFQSGWCLLEARKIVVLNKFLSMEGRINTLMDIIPQLAVEYDRLTLGSQKLYDEVVKKSITEA